jgi:hypothetical protein
MGQRIKTRMRCMRSAARWHVGMKPGVRTRERLAGDRDIGCRPHVAHAAARRLALRFLIFAPACSACCEGSPSGVMLIVAILGASGDKRAAEVETARASFRGALTRAVFSATVARRCILCMGRCARPRAGRGLVTGDASEWSAVGKRYTDTQCTATPMYVHSSAQSSSSLPAEGPLPSTPSLERRSSNSCAAQRRRAQRQTVTVAGVP